MKSLRSITLATSVPALFAASSLYAAGDTITEQRSAPRQLGGPGTSASQSIQSEAGDSSSRAESANRYGDQQSGNTGAVGSASGSTSDEGMAGSTGAQGRVDPVWTQSNEAPQPGEPAGSSSESISGSASDSASGSATSGSTELGTPAPEPLNNPNPSSSPSYER